MMKTEEGNLESDTFPSKEDYEYSDVVCENTNDKINVLFNEEGYSTRMSIAIY